MSVLRKFTAEQLEEEREFSAHLRDGECGTVKSIVGNDASPRALLHVVDNARALAEAIVEDNHGPDSPKLACREGCGWCCHQAVLVTAPEVFRIIEYLRGMDEASRTAILDKLRRLDGRTRGLTPQGRGKLRAPCAFLSEDGRCNIYSARPFACAKFTSVDVKDCIRGYQNGFRDGSVTGDKARMLIFDAVRSGMLRGMREALPAADTAPLELTAAVLDAWDSRDAAADWRAGKPIFERAHLAMDDE